jgi:hypothetical protein
MLWNFLEGANERFPRLAETETNILVHTVGTELNLNDLHVSGFSGEDGGARGSTSQKTAFFNVITCLQV